MQTSVPAITFLSATILRLEQVNILRRDGLAKIVGTIASVGGATTITLYKGIPLLHLTEQPQGNSLAEQYKMLNWTWGCIFLLGHCFSWAGYLVYQASMLKKYPAKLSLTSYTCLFGLVQFLFIAAFTETNYDHWKITSLEELFTILYAGIVASGVVISLQIWCIYKGGPVCVAVFQPVQTVLVIVMDALFLGDQLYSGEIVGSIIVTLGLYSVLWGKTVEYKIANQDREDQLTKHLIEDTKQTPEDYVASHIP